MLSNQVQAPHTGHRQRLRQRFLAGEAEAVQADALLELLLTFALPQQDVAPLARRLLDRFGSLSHVFHADPHELLAISGVKEQTLTLLKLVERIADQSAPSIAPAISASTLPAHDASAPLATPLQKIPAVQGDSDDPAVPMGLAESTATSKTPRRAKITTNQVPVLENAGFRDALAILPHVPLTIASRAEMSAYLRDHLNLNASESRRRMAEYLTRRLFPAGTPDRALLRLAHAFPDAQILRDALFARYCQTEPLLPLVMQEVIVPALQQYLIPRERLQHALRRYFPDAQTIEKPQYAITHIWRYSGVVRVTPTGFQANAREINPETFAFVLHDLFPQPSIYDIAAIESHPVIRALLWHPKRLMAALFALRDRGWITQIVEIDRLRQITTTHTRESMTATLLGE